MEELIKQLQMEMEEKYNLLENKELEKYQSLLNRNWNTIAPTDLFLYAYHTRNEKSWEENKQLVDTLLKNGYFQNEFQSEFQKIIQDKTDFQIKNRIYILSYLIKNRIEKWKNKQEYEKSVRFADFSKEELLYWKKYPDKEKLCSFLNFFYQLSDQEKKIFAIFDGLLTKRKEALDIVSKMIINHIKKLEKIEKEKRQNQRNIKAVYERRIEALITVTEDSYLSLKEEEFQIYSIDLLKKLQNAFLIHNQKIIKSLENTIKNSSMEQERKILLLLKKYKIELEEENQTRLKEFDLSLIEERLQQLKSFSCSNITLYLFLPEENFGCVMFLLEKEAVSFAFLEKNNYLLTDFAKLNQMKETLEYFETNKKSFYLRDEILLLDKNLINERMHNATLYHLENKIIFEEQFIKSIDLWIEMGFYALLLENLDVLGTNLWQVTKRIFLAKQLRLPIFNEKGKLLSSILDDNKFILKEEIEDPLENCMGLSYPDMPIFWEDYEKDSMHYQIGNYFVSKPRVNRNLLEGKKNLEALFQGSFYSYLESLEMIKMIKEKAVSRSLTKK